MVDGAVVAAGEVLVGCRGERRSRSEAAVEDDWIAYFEDPSRWWDNRASKNNPRAPDFRHKKSKRALWIDGWYSPDWVKEGF